MRATDKYGVFERKKVSETKNIKKRSRESATAKVFKISHKVYYCVYESFLVFVALVTLCENGRNFVERYFVYGKI